MQDKIDQTAVAVSEMLLKRTGEALSARNFNLFMSAFALPQTVRTYEGTRIVTTIEEMKAMFGKVCDEHQRMAVTNMVRFCVAAQYKGLDRVEATHVSHLLSGTTRVTDPYPVFSVIERIDGDWQIISSDYAVEPGGGIARALLYAGTPATSPTNAMADDALRSMNTPNSGQTHD